MNIAKLTTILSFTAVLAVAAPSLSFANSSSDPANDDTGQASLGIDISTAGDNPAEVHQFLGTLASDTRREVLGGCETILSGPADTAANVVSFCENATDQAPRQAF
jgi:hypothetical protein